MKKHSTKKKSFKKKVHSSTGWLTKYRPRSTVHFAPELGVGRSVATRLKGSLFLNFGAPGVAPYSATNILLPGSAFNPFGTINSTPGQMFTEWASMFAQYLVTDATVMIEWMQPFGSTTASLIAAYPASTSVIPVANANSFAQFASQPYSQGHMLQPSIPPPKMFFKMNSQKILGKQLPVTAEDNGAAVTASPTAGQFMTLPFCIQSVSNGSSSAIMRITIVQDVIFSSRIQQPS